MIPRGQLWIKLLYLKLFSLELIFHKLGGSNCQAISLKFNNYDYKNAISPMYTHYYLGNESSEVY